MTAIGLRIVAAILALAFAGPALAQSTPASGASTSGTAVPSISSTAATASAPVNSTAIGPATSSDYKLGVGDKVRIIVYNEPTLSGEFAVSDNGSLSLPLIGDIRADGRSLREVVGDVEQKLGDGYLKSPRVSLDVLTYRPFYILGEVSKPGEYPYSSGLTVMNAVARAEGFTYRANKRKVFIKHSGEANENIVKLVPDLNVQPGDTIRIGERYF